MPGKKRKAAINASEVSVYQRKLRKRPPPKLSKAEKKKYTFKFPFPQEFSISPNILFYIAQNPKFPKGHRKLISSCKSLLRMSKILPVKSLSHFFYRDDCNNWEADRANINLKNKFFKFWIYDEARIQTRKLPYLASTLVKQNWKFSLQNFHFQNQVLTFGELQILVSGSHLEYVYFDKNIIKSDDGKVTEFEKVFELLCCKNFFLTFHSEHHGIGKNTASKINEILSFNQAKNAQSIEFWNVPQDLDFCMFSEFLKTNMTDKKHTFRLSFSKEISDAYKSQLQQFVNEIIQIRGIYAHTVPIIEFRGQNKETHDQLFKMRYENVEGIRRKRGTFVCSSAEINIFVNRFFSINIFDKCCFR